MRTHRSQFAFAFLVTLALAGCKASDHRDSTTYGNTKEYRACCETHCDANCPEACCREHFSNKAVAGEYCANCNKVCNASCVMACCKK